MGQIISDISNVLYSYVLIILLVAGGIYFTIRTKFAQFRLFKDQIKSVTEKKTDKKGVSSFQALMVSTASRVGTGNIIGVSTAILFGGFGSVFWMWVIAFFGMATIYAEAILENKEDFLFLMFGKNRKEQYHETTYCICFVNCSDCRLVGL